MDTTTFDGFSRQLAGTLTRRGALRGLAAGAIAIVVGGVVREETSAKRQPKKRKKKTHKRAPMSPTSPPSPPTPPVCAGENWCVDRTQTCGPTGGHGKCLITSTGDNICAEILFQAPSCADCEAPNCTNCRCALAAGGGDRCNNGANGYDYICVREV